MAARTLPTWSCFSITAIFKHRKLMHAYSISCLRVSIRLYTLGCKSFDTFVFYHLVCLWQGWGGCFCSLVIKVFVVWDTDCCKNCMLFFLSSSTDGLTTEIPYAFVLLRVEIIFKIQVVAHTVILDGSFSLYAY